MENSVHHQPDFKFYKSLISGLDQIQNYAEQYVLYTPSVKRTLLEKLKHLRNGVNHHLNASHFSKRSDLYNLYQYASHGLHDLITERDCWTGFMIRPLEQDLKYRYAHLKN